MNRTLCGVALLLVSVFLCEGGLSAAEQSGMPTSAASVELTARIMEINLVEDYMVVAEKKIQLLSSVKEGVKVWITVFQDADGNRISFNNFRQQDRVRIKGVRGGGGRVDAHEVTLLPPKRGNLSPQPSSPVFPTLK